MASTVEGRGATTGELAGVVAGRLVGSPDILVRDVTHDSRQAGPATLFVAIPGSSFDGHDYVARAVQAGSPAVLVERLGDQEVTQIVVASSRAAAGPAAATVHHHPSRRLRMVGVTGTNGKTTVTHMVEAMVEGAGLRSGLIGTVHTRIGAEAIPNPRTTPEATDFQRLLADMADRGTEVVAAEVSSHALELHRVDATWFEVGAFTNLSQDHLDFHGDMDSYFHAKTRLFAPDRCGRAVVFVDDPAGRRLLDTLVVEALTVGEGGDVRLQWVESGVGSSRFSFSSPEGGGTVELPVGGRFNVDNALMAIGCVVSLGIDLDRALDGLRGFGGVPGRFELVSGNHPVRVLVDYAHTPAGIEGAIATVRASGASRVTVVFGAGGNRDRGKRPLMARATSGADRIIVTSDNPRDEDPDAIIDDVVGGLDPGVPYERIADRAEAIQRAVTGAGVGDVVLILGKGHERGQEIAGRSLPFDDRLVARRALAGRPDPETDRQ